jgi:hypothetical protein
MWCTPLCSGFHVFLLCYSLFFSLSLCCFLILLPAFLVSLSSTCFSSCITKWYSFYIASCTSTSYTAFVCHVLEYQFFPVTIRFHFISSEMVCVNTVKCFFFFRKLKTSSSTWAEVTTSVWALARTRHVIQEATLYFQTILRPRKVAVGLHFSF